jgi:hypothetical protein
MGHNIKYTSYPGSDAQGAGSFNFGHWYLFVIRPACATYLRPPKRGLRVVGSRFGEGRSDHKPSPFGDEFKVTFHLYGATNNACFDIKGVFLFGGLSLNHEGFRAYNHASYVVHGIAK